MKNWFIYFDTTNLTNVILSSDLNYGAPISFVASFVKMSKSDVRLASNYETSFEVLHNILNFSSGRFVEKYDCQKSCVFPFFKL